MVKVLIATCADRMNGTERYAVDIARHLPKDKFEVALITAMKGPLAEILKSYNIEEICIDNGTLNYYKRPGIKNLYRIMKSRKFDVVHANAGIIPCMIGKYFGTKLTLETKHGLFFTEEQLNSLSLKQKLHEKLKEKFVNYTIAISENDRSRLLNYLSLNPKKIKVIYNGIDLKKFNPEGKFKEFNSSNIVFANIGRFTFQKAQEYLVKSFIPLAKKYDNIKLLLVGEGENKPSVIEMVRSSGIEDKVEIQNYRKDIESLYNEIDVLVMSSRYEGIPYVILESMAYGKPVVSTNVGGISEVIKNEINGYITEVGDIAGLSNSLEKFILNPMLVNEFGNQNLKRIRKYDVLDMVKKYEELYSQAK